MDPKELYLSKPWLKYYPKGVPSEVDVPEISVPALFDRMADKYADKTALIFYGNKISYKKLKELIDRFATALIDLGVTKGQTVALYLLNCPQYVIAYFAEYLPLLKKHLGKSALGKIYGEMHIPTPKYIEEAGLLQFQTLIKKYPPRPPQITIH